MFRHPFTSNPGSWALAAVLLAVPAALGQSRTYEMTDQGWSPTKAPEPGTDAAVIADARQKLADRKISEALKILDTWIEANETSKSQYLAEAYLLRGDCKLADMDEYEALRDYEKVTKEFAGSEYFVKAMERELTIAKMYFGGMRKKTFGLRIDSGIPYAEEICMRINERLAGSRLAEEAMITMADYYYTARDLRMAAESYDVFLKLFPKSEQRQKAMQRRVYANIAQFKGPQYDATGLVEARYQIQRFQTEFPAEAEQSGMGDALVARLDESAAEQRLVTAEWYLKRGDPISARLTLQRLVRAFPRTAAAEKATDILNKNGWPIVAPKAPRMNPPREDPNAKDKAPAVPSDGSAKPAAPSPATAPTTAPAANPPATPAAGPEAPKAPVTPAPKEGPK